MLILNPTSAADSRRTRCPTWLCFISWAVNTSERCDVSLLALIRPSFLTMNSTVVLPDLGARSLQYNQLRPVWMTELQLLRSLFSLVVRVRRTIAGATWADE